MMADSRKVRITLESVQDGSSHTHAYKGDWFRKEKSIFIRYIEPAVEGDTEAGEIRTLIRFRPEEMSMVRRGAIESEQLFVPGHRRSGHYQSQMTSLSLEAETLRLLLHAPGDDGVNKEMGTLPEQLPFTIEWEYELYVDDQMSGRFHIRLHIQEEQN
jgi:uncharacterized beta-barrel protein YwiB (DUF1934 family)